MARDEVFQMRLTSEEKARLSRLAGDESIAKLIRRTFGLDAAEPKAGPIPSKPTDLVGDILAAATAGENQPDPVRIAQLKNQGYTTPVATRMAREELKEP